ncbi:MAG: hypothetical protein HOB99_03915 [Candidatus Marinimicrobia bacterium]|jgi:hypothetical protein|nr:hypothetical protein [Candidatus Neomarinimicrobiota bacterium]MBT4053886.1 hypothetical protein [Candidatus Neomarinimicrobiota bacterium]MBT4635732.1 hypothetical protein [Candidatus Neomarinimicrobiota bacterium]MBT5759065.1 hypothetical protein [Candidatus Neomarinimicrobiota bacterium]
MKKKSLLLIVLFFISCKETFENNVEKDEDIISLEIEPRLDQDDNGYYHLEINPRSWQTIHRISGHVYMNDKTLEVLKVFWEASHFWYLGDTLGYIVRRGLTDDLEYVSYDTSYITGFTGFEVPIVNSASYSNAAGEVNTMFAPVRTMLGDTVTVWVYYWNNDYKLVEQSIGIVLD